MWQAQGHHAGLQLVHAFRALDDEDANTLTEEMARTGVAEQVYSRSAVRGGPAVLVYYSPAFLRHVLKEDALLGLSVLAEIYRAARELWPLDEGEEGCTKTVNVGKLVGLEAIDLRRKRWVLRRASEQEAMVEQQQPLHEDET